MARVKGGAVSKNRRRKVLKQAKGYFGSKHRLYKTAQEQLFHSGAYAFRDLESMSLADLKALAKEKGLKGFSTLKKDELIKKLK